MSTNYLAALMVILLPIAAIKVVAFAKPHYPFAWGNVFKLYLCLLFFVVGLLHFVAPSGVVSLMPEWIPQRLLICYLTGALEFAFVVLLWTRYARPTAYVILAYLVASIPFNIYGWTIAENSPNYVDDPYYLWFRVPMQFVFGLFAYYGAIKERSSRSHSAVVTVTP